MSTCNATLHSFECNDHAEGAGRPHVNRREGVVVTWADEAPGAKPHTPPRYYDPEAFGHLTSTLKQTPWQLRESRDLGSEWLADQIWQKLHDRGWTVSRLNGVDGDAAVSNPEADAVRQLGRALRERDVARGQRDRAQDAESVLANEIRTLRDALQIVTDSLRHQLVDIHADRHHGFSDSTRRVESCDTPRCAGAREALKIARAALKGADHDAA